MRGPRPGARTILRAIALAEGKLLGHPNYLTKKQMILLAKRWLELIKKSNA